MGTLLGPGAQGTSSYYKKLVCAAECQFVLESTILSTLYEFVLQSPVCSTEFLLLPVSIEVQIEVVALCVDDEVEEKKDEGAAVVVDVRFVVAVLLLL